MSNDNSTDSNDKSTDPNDNSTDPKDSTDNSAAQTETELTSRAYDRENFEPEELSNPLPKWFAVMSACLVLWGFGYFYFQGVVPLNAGDRRTAIAPAGSVPADGKVVYAANCVACHQGNGLGISGAFPPLAGAEWVLTNPVIPAQILLHGLQGPIEVAGNSYSGAMPVMAHLSDNELAAVLNYIRTDWGNNGSEVTPEWFAEQRERFTDRGPWEGGAELVSVFGEPTVP